MSNPIPIIITLMGHRGVGKSYYLFSLGLALRRYLVDHPPLRGHWQVQKFSESYKDLLNRWDKQQRDQGTLEKTARGTILPLWFDIEQIHSKRRYRVFLIEMAGDEMANGEVKSTEGPFSSLSYLCQSYVKISTSTWLMLESQTCFGLLTDQAREGRKLIEQFLQMFQPTKPVDWVNICLMKADVLEKADFLEEVQEKLRPKRKLMEEYGDCPLEDVLDDAQYREEIVKGFFEHNAHTVEIIDLLKKRGLEDRTRYYSLSSLGLQLDQEKDREIFNKSARFVAYNLFKPILDILDAVEQHFETEEIKNKNRGILMLFNRLFNKTPPPQEEYCQTLVDQIETIQVEQARRFETQANSLKEREDELKVAKKRHDEEARKVAEARDKVADRSAELKAQYQAFEEQCNLKEEGKRKLEKECQGLQRELGLQRQRQNQLAADLKKANSLWRKIKWVVGGLLSLFFVSAIGTHFYLADNQLEMLCVVSAGQPLDCQLPSLITVPKSEVDFNPSPQTPKPAWLTFDKQHLTLSGTWAFSGEFRLKFLAETNQEGGGLFILDPSATLWKKGRNVFGVVGMGKSLEVEVNILVK